MTGASPTQTLTVDLTGRSQLRLVLDPNGVTASTTTATGPTPGSPAARLAAVRHDPADDHRRQSDRRRDRPGHGRQRERHLQRADRPGDPDRHDRQPRRPGHDDAARGEPRLRRPEPDGDPRPERRPGQCHDLRRDRPRRGERRQGRRRQPPRRRPELVVHDRRRAAGGTHDTSYLSDLAYTVTANGFGPAEKDRSNGEAAAGDGRPLTLAGVVYAKGIGAHAASDIRYNLAGCTTFTVKVGLDDEVGSNGSLSFQIWGDATKLADSGIMTGASPTQTLTVDLTGRSQLRLVVDPNGASWHDHGDWADARLTCA